MLYMIIERFKDGAAPDIYRRARAQGRMTSAEAAQIMAPRL
jgi:hypothetical protein